MNLARGYRESKIPIGAKRVFEGVIFDTYHWEQKLYDGSTAIFEMLARPDTVVVFPVLPDGRILLIEDAQPHRAAEVTAPAGRVEEGETPEAAAARELLEETGYAAERLELLLTRQPAEKIDHLVYVYLGHGAHKVAEPHLDAGERIALHPVTTIELERLAASDAYPYSAEIRSVLSSLSRGR